jgi:hypothetical protein
MTTTRNEDQIMDDDRRPVLDYHYRRRTVPYAGASAYRSLRPLRKKSKREWIVLLPFMLAFLWIALGVFVRLLTKA